jgi:hypothetical protein
MDKIDPKWLVTLATSLDNLKRVLTKEEKQMLKKHYFKYLHDGYEAEEAFQKALGYIDDQKKEK